MRQQNQVQIKRDDDPNYENVRETFSYLYTKQKENKTSTHKSIKSGTLYETESFVNDSKYQRMLLC